MHARLSGPLMKRMDTVPVSEWGRSLPPWAHWSAVAAYAGVIFFLSAQSYPEEYLPYSLLEELGDKVLHGIEFGILAVLCYRAFRYAAGPWASRQALILAVVTAIAYGLTDEIHQAFVPLREADAMDLMADGLGAVLAGYVWSRMVEPMEVSRGDGSGPPASRRFEPDP